VEAVSIFTPTSRDTLRMEVKNRHVQQLSQGGDRAFEHLFKAHFKGLHAYATTILQDSSLAEEMVQIVFVKLYEQMQRITIEASIESYLYRCIYYESLNHQKHEKVKAHYKSYALRQQDQASMRPDEGGGRELEMKLRKALHELPEQCRTIFQMSRFEDLKYREIADRLKISVKTVENQMGKALRILRVSLAEFLPLLLVVLSTCINRLF
jgi:RNA polymerase sigma-70 factor (ECF subfamily)